VEEMIKILTLNWNGNQYLQALGPGLLCNVQNLARKGFEAQWHIRDNGSTDDSIKTIVELGATVYSIGHNRDSYAIGMNYLFNNANIQDDDIVLLLNNDIVFPEEDSLFKMLELLKDNIGIVGARLLYLNTDKLQHAGVIFGERYGKMPYHYRHKEVSDKEAKRNREFQAVTAACCFVRASDWRKVGGMSEEYRWCFDDIDFCLKIGKNLGKKIMYCGGVKIFHEESVSLKKNPVNTLMMPHNVKVFKDKWFGKYDLDHDKYLKNKDYLAI
jgi:GT2 family glycosyltransferase